MCAHCPFPWPTIQCPGRLPGHRYSALTLLIYLFYIASASFRRWFAAPAPIYIYQPVRMERGLIIVIIIAETAGSSRAHNCSPLWHPLIWISIVKLYVYNTPAKKAARKSFRNGALTILLNYQWLLPSDSQSVFLYLLYAYSYLC